MPQPHLSHTPTPSPLLPQPGPSKPRPPSGSGGGGRGYRPGGAAGRGSTGSPGSSCCLWAHCVTGSIIYPWQGPAPERLALPISQSATEASCCERTLTLAQDRHPHDKGVMWTHAHVRLNRQTDTPTRQTSLNMEVQEHPPHTDKTDTHRNGGRHTHTHTHTHTPVPCTWPTWPRTTHSSPRQSHVSPAPVT